jgi:hypothetical protein
MLMLRTTSINKRLIISLLSREFRVIIYEVRVHQFTYKEEKIVCEEKGKKNIVTFCLLTSGLLYDRNHLSADIYKEFMP